MVETTIRSALKGALDYSDMQSGINLNLSVLDVAGKWPTAITKVMGTAYDDIIYGNNTVGQQLFGGAGNDTFFGKAMKTNYVGGDGADTVNFSALGCDVYVDMTKNTSYRGETFSSIENLVGGNGHNTLIGNAEVNVLTGGNSSDILDGRGGADVMIGGKGDDMYHVDNLNDQVIEKAGEGTDIVVSKISWTLGDNIEDLQLDGSNAIDATGNAAANRLYGNAADNKLFGMEGDDLLRGGAGNDALDGGSGNDKLYGEAGQDWLTGGSGKDTFYFSAVSDSKVSTPDHITDFVRGEDKISLSAIDANAAKGGDQAFAFIGDKEFTKSAGQLRFEHHDDYTVVQGDVNGDGVADFAIQLDHFSYSLTSSDFVL